MKLAIVHLSDFHFSARTDVGFKRREKLANAVTYAKRPDEQLLVLLTGDIANTGSPEEYRVAEDFFRPLFIGLGLDFTTAPSPITIVPGNHDCNFRDVGDLRPRLLNEISQQLDTIDPSGETASTLLQVQTDFFSFQKDLTGEEVKAERRLYNTRRYDFAGKIVELRCFNSAWLSTRHEEPGSLGFPSSIAETAAEGTDADVVLSLVHHPANWLNPSVYQAFRAAVQETSDFLFTGHEHTLGGQIIMPFSGSNLIHFESGPYQPHRSGNSEFGMLHLDLDTGEWRHEDFRWSAGSYAKLHDTLPQKLSDKSERAATLQVTRSFLERLSEPGTGFLHPRKQKLELSDIYIYPDLKTRSVSRKLKGSGDLPKTISSKDVPEKLLKASRVVLAGPDDSGKTALSKTLFLEGNNRFGFSSLLLCGKILQGADPEEVLLSAINEAIDQQYGAKSRGHYAGLNQSERVLLIDDWDEVGFNRAGRAAILTRASALFDKIFLFVDDIFLIEELSGRNEIAPLADYEVADIREFGFLLRGRMIRKWHSLGNTYLEDEQSLARRVVDSTRVIDTVLGRNLLPSHPVNILTLLQTYEAEAGTRNGGLGSYGQVYEALITARLAKVSIKSIDIGTKITFLSNLAWFLFQNQKGFITEREWSALSNQYYAEYRIPISSDSLRTSCIDAGVLSITEGGYRFSYGYAYCYFVAKYFQENLADLSIGDERTKLFDRLKALSERVYNQSNANIVIFYVFLTKDRSLINYVIANARKIFEDVSEFDFSRQLRFVSSAITLKPVQLPSGNAETNQQAYDRRRDEAEDNLEPGGDPAMGEKCYSSDLPFEHKLIFGIRYMTLMGQVLRNFPGSLKADTKLELAFESYSLGLRLLSAVFDLAQADSGAAVREVKDVLRTRLAFSGTDRELTDQAESIIAELLRHVTYGLLKRVSHAVGLRELEATYEDVAALRDDNVSNRMIQLSIKLDHFELFPKSDIEYLAESFEKNVFSYQTLRDLVLNHLYLFPREYEVQQWSGSVLGMKVHTPEIRGGARKIRGSSTIEDH